MFIRADAIVDEISVNVFDKENTYKVTVTCPDNSAWKETYTLTAKDDNRAAQAAIDRFVSKYAAME